MPPLLIVLFNDGDHADLFGLDDDDLEDINDESLLIPDTDLDADLDADLETDLETESAMLPKSLIPSPLIDYHFFTKKQALDYIDESTAQYGYALATKFSKRDANAMEIYVRYPRRDFGGTFRESIDESARKQEKIQQDLWTAHFKRGSLG
ncbi:uncharacterized protein BO95DRAFT_464816 [Aspergillus brunneoviolaceus CBS 621.78]|uniref:Uncharacterized protein n=1 Tax=Aspergillus brunneoviolaceus CBS 621.78 TaxID=1450534 RepID=A0ACD1G5S6_9EURO|nr:hypothetical protein BO95DRAFT_464816 [Aspergillus brunneoviolaceus CBS 621.78]RAH44574.1 hypothetical protein BO95DRAFT_464816 [Aspergillus brunneoviolaceus CBS 621.78]